MSQADDDAPLHALEGTFVRLEPLELAHLDGLVVAANENRSTYTLTTVPQTRKEMLVYIAGLDRDETTTPFAQVRKADETVVGVTRFINPRPHAIEIGGTWLSASAQGTALNSEAKLLLLAHAFDALRLQRVELLTDARNERSRGGILAIGARYEGTLRNWQASRALGEEGKLRDSAIFSIIDAEWPAVRERLVARIERLSNS